MKLLAMDTETHLLKHSYVLDGAKKKTLCGHMLAPRLVVLSWYDGSAGGLCDHADAIAFAFRVLTDDEILITGHNIAYDFAVLAADEPNLLPLILRAYERNRIRDTKIRQMLIDIGKGELTSEGKQGFRHDPSGAATPSKLDLNTLAGLWLLRSLDKSDDSWRYRYGELDGVPLSDWPEGAKTYPLEDARATYDVDQAQDAWIASCPPEFPDGKLHNQHEQCKGAFALHLMSTWGVRTDPVMVRTLCEFLDAECEAARAELKGTGIYKPKSKKDPDGKQSKDMKKIYALVEQGFAAQGLQPPRTPTGLPCTDEETYLASGIGELIILAQSMKSEKLRNTYAPMLRLGTKWPICARFNVLVETGRTSCMQPNLQNPPRKGGVRDCFIPRPGHVYCTVDFDTAELRSLAQVCLVKLKYSKLAEAFQQDKDPHLMLGAQLLNTDYADITRRYKAGEKIAEEARQFAKVGNFGFPGGLGAPSFVDYAKSNGVVLDSDDLRAHRKAQAIRDAWFQTWAEMQDYFLWIGGIVGPAEGQVIQLYSGRRRGRVTFTEAANSMFQGLTADGAKAALWAVTAACYGAKPGDLMYGVRPVVFLHDEIIAEVPEGSPEQMHAAAHEQARLMREAMQRWVPDVPIKCSPTLMRRWFKGAKAVTTPAGLLVPAKPDKQPDGRTLWVHDA